MSSSSSNVPAYSHPVQFRVVEKGIYLAQEKGVFNLQQASEIYTNLVQLSNLQMHKPEFIQQAVDERQQLVQLLEEYKNAIERLRIDNQNLRRRHIEIEGEMRTLQQNHDIQVRKSEELQKLNDALRNDSDVTNESDNVKSNKSKGKKKVGSD